MCINTTLMAFEEGDASHHNIDVDCFIHGVLFVDRLTKQFIYIINSMLFRKESRIQLVMEHGPEICLQAKVICVHEK